MSAFGSTPILRNSYKNVVLLPINTKCSKEHFPVKTSLILVAGHDKIQATSPLWVSSRFDHYQDKNNFPHSNASARDSTVTACVNTATGTKWRIRPNHKYTCSLTSPTHFSLSSHLQGYHFNAARRIVTLSHTGVTIKIIRPAIDWSASVCTVSKGATGYLIQFCGPGLSQEPVNCDHIPTSPSYFVMSVPTVSGTG